MWLSWSGLAPHLQTAPRHSQGMAVRAALTRKFTMLHCLRPVRAFCGPHVASTIRVCTRVCNNSAPGIGRGSRRVLQPLLPRTAAVQQAEPELSLDATYSTIVDRQMTWPSRTHGAGTLREADVGNEITICGWVDRNRPMGGLTFMDVRDHTGLLQVAFRTCVAACHAG